MLGKGPFDAGGNSESFSLQTRTAVGESRPTRVGKAALKRLSEGDALPKTCQMGPILAQNSNQTPEGEMRRESQS